VDYGRKRIRSMLVILEKLPNHSLGESADKSLGWLVSAYVWERKRLK
jgi:hypothetical protein